MVLTASTDEDPVEDEAASTDEDESKPWLTLSDIHVVPTTEDHEVDNVWYSVDGEDVEDNGTAIVTALDKI